MNRVMAFILIIVLTPIMFTLALIIMLSDKFPVLYRQQRPGRENVMFTFYKFRTMKNNTPEIATHLLSDSENYLLPFGKFMRKVSLDELPNLLNVLKGDMVFVGPRPALHNQYDLIELRNNLGINRIKPGITGWAQVNGRDELSLAKKVEYDKFYVENKSMLLDIRIILITIVKVLRMKSIAH